MDCKVVYEKKPVPDCFVSSDLFIRYHLTPGTKDFKGERNKSRSLCSHTHARFAADLPDLNRMILHLLFPDINQHKIQDLIQTPG